MNREEARQKRKELSKKQQVVDSTEGRKIAYITIGVVIIALIILYFIFRSNFTV